MGCGRRTSPLGSRTTSRRRAERVAAPRWVVGAVLSAQAQQLAVSVITRASQPFKCGRVVVDRRFVLAGDLSTEAEQLEDDDDAGARCRTRGEHRAVRERAVDELRAQCARVVRDALRDESRTWRQALMP